ncbi:hypothetical protein ACH5RR_024765 [Cinchona calisaya]|uniref:GH3 middle domain-containing protein n=1 Tax=Cinchona calisaya TaxID=153742 RepID=A0ABD2YYS6_9GENT
MQSVIVLNKQMPELANLIEQECGGRKSWGGIIERLWPKAKCVGVISMAPCIPTVQFYTGSLPLVSMMYVSSKGYFGINLNPLSKTADQVSYTLLPNMACYEFRPFNGIHKESTQEDLQNGIPDTNCMVVDLANLKIGQSYELLVTTFTGMA